MKNFNDYIKEEISIKGNQGIPGEGDDKSGGEYLSDVERRARERLGVPREEDPRTGPPRQTMHIGGEIMQIMSQSMRMLRGKEKQLENLALKIILDEYGTLLDNVDLDIKIITPGKVKDFMDEEDAEKEDMPSYQLLEDDQIKKEVDKRKIINNITQGEAKNTKRIMAMPEVKEEILKIFGDTDGNSIHGMWMRISELADKMDWLIPVDLKGEMMEEAPQGLAGAVSVKWPEMKTDDELSDKILKSLENKEDISENEEDIKELLSSGNPIIKARGIDFPMLLHETVKGIYELIAAAGIPEDKRTAELVMMNTSSFEDEAEEFRFGPEIASDIRNFINKSKEDLDRYPNIREHFYGKLHAMPADEFLEIVKSILSNSGVSRGIVDKMIGQVIKELDEYEVSNALSKFGDDEAWKESDKEEEEESVPVIDKSIDNEEEDLSQLSQWDIQSMIDDALDNKDYEEVKKLSQYLKEGRNIYLNELSRINENKR